MHPIDSPDGQAPDVDDVSKSQRKRDAKSLFKLGRQLASLPESVFRELPLDERLREALEEARAIKSHVARKRQLGFVAKLMRQSDMGPVIASMETRNNAALVDTAQQHRVELWRDGLIAGETDGLTALLSLRRDADAQPLRQLVRNAQRELAAGKPPASSRKLFRMLRDLDQVAPLPPWPAG